MRDASSMNSVARFSEPVRGGAMVESVSAQPFIDDLLATFDNLYEWLEGTALLGRLPRSLLLIGHDEPSMYSPGEWRRFRSSEIYPPLL